MPTYSTTGPVDVAVNLQVGSLRVAASDRTDAVVTVSPTDPAKAVDRRAAEDTRVEFDGMRVTVTSPRPRFSLVGPFESLDVTIEVPAGSRLTAEIGQGCARTTGTLGATRIKASGGWVEVDEAADLWVRAGHGAATIGTARGTLEVTADHGQIKVGAVTGDAALKASHGSITIGQAGGEVEAKLSYGDLDIDRAAASVTAKTAYGSVRIGEASGGALELESGYGAVTVGVRRGVPAWLDLSSKNGRVRNQLDGDGAPAPGEQTVAVRARTQFGDITVQRAQ
ncbi:MAG TPA: DUF4097 family beta strand repeat-containing protein [Rhodoglobus sp.]|nr:DUF4097 family beta strand repeat-containing protein [Rhodoglobus sp.]